MVYGYVLLKVIRATVTTPERINVMNQKKIAPRAALALCLSLAAAASPVVARE